MPAATIDHYNMVLAGMTRGQVVPFLGAGVNLCERPAGTPWEAGREFLPNAEELSKHLARELPVPLEDVGNLNRVCEYAAVIGPGIGPLYFQLRRVFDADYAPTAVHRFLAALPKELRRRGYGNPRDKPKGWELLVVTTNYDDLLEQEFRAAKEPFDLVSYSVPDAGFMHYPPDGEPRLINEPNTYAEVSLNKRAVILKLHGMVDRRSRERDSFVITEEDYIDYLARSDVSKLIPSVIMQELQESHLLFLGYSLRDWNLRVIFRRIWGLQAFVHQQWKPWAIQKNLEKLEQKLWENRGVDIIDQDLAEYVRGLQEGLDRLGARAETKAVP